MESLLPHGGVGGVITAAYIVCHNCRLKPNLQIPGEIAGDYL